MRQRYRSNTHVVGLTLSVLIAFVLAGWVLLANDDVGGLGTTDAQAWHADGIDWDSCKDPDPEDRVILKSVLNCRARAAAWAACHDKGNIHISTRGGVWIDGAWVQCDEPTVTVDPDSCVRVEAVPYIGVCKIHYLVYDVTDRNKMARCEGRVTSRLDFGKPFQVFSKLQSLECNKFDPGIA